MINNASLSLSLTHECLYTARQGGCPGEKRQQRLPPRQDHALLCGERSDAEACHVYAQLIFEPRSSHTHLSCAFGILDFQPVGCSHRHDQRWQRHRCHGLLASGEATCTARATIQRACARTPRKCRPPLSALAPPLTRCRTQLRGRFQLHGPSRGDGITTSCCRPRCAPTHHAAYDVFAASRTALEPLCALLVQGRCTPQVPIFIRFRH
jgi:hypothetical protein